MESAAAGDTHGKPDNESKTRPEPSFSNFTQGLSLPVPQYPDAAKRFGYEGVFKVSIIIDKNGNVTDIVLDEYSRHKMLNREVMNTIKKSWSFNPPGRKITIIKELVFQLTLPQHKQNWNLRPQGVAVGIYPP